jgi:hypothetical protein
MGRPLVTRPAQPSPIRPTRPNWPLLYPSYIAGISLPTAVRRGPRRQVPAISPDQSAWGKGSGLLDPDLAEAFQPFAAEGSPRRHRFDPVGGGALRL